MTGCATSPKVVGLNLPPAPADFGAPVAVPYMKQGENPKAVAARLAAALSIANRRLENDYVWYSEVRDSVAKLQP